MGRDERDVIVVERGGGLTWLVVGAALGAGLALLFAPKTGKELRRELGKGIRGIRDLADETIAELKIEFGTQHEPELRPAPTGGVADAEEERPARPSRPRVSGAREELERRLESARARRRGTEPEDEEPVA